MFQNEAAWALDETTWELAGRYPHLLSGPCDNPICAEGMVSLGECLRCRGSARRPLPMETLLRRAEASLKLRLPSPKYPEGWHLGRVYTMLAGRAVSLPSQPPWEATARIVIEMEG